LDHLIIYDRGFLLSILSVYGIITGYNLYEKYFKPEKMIFLEKFNLNKIILYWLNKIISMLLITFFAQISILPVLIKSFHKVSLISLFSNLFLIPISAAIMAIVPAGVLLNEYVWASDIIFYALKLLTKLFIKLSYLFSSLPYSFVYISFRNELNFAFVSAMIFIFLNLPIINIKSSLARSWIWFIVIGFVFSFMWKDKKFGVFEFENYSVKGYLILKPQGAYLINPTITAEKIISAVFDSGFNKIDAIMVGSGSAFRKKEIEKIKNVLKVERIYAPLWKCSEDFICVFPKDKADIFEVKFKNDYGYFDDKTKLLFCDKDRCY
ncbi:MAG: ComEC/Rec2 family competence protein, partial [Elusimicrobiales bacterium]|nr:ComEC/Rec2 family competence protein [Elusimicrobiales bacterium]